MELSSTQNLNLYLFFFFVLFCADIIISTFLFLRLLLPILPILCFTKTKPTYIKRQEQDKTIQLKMWNIFKASPWQVKATNPTNNFYNSSFVLFHRLTIFFVVVIVIVIAIPFVVVERKKKWNEWMNERKKSLISRTMPFNI